MPLFDFKCKEGHYFERQTRLDIEECPACGKDATKVFLKAPIVGVLHLGGDTSMTTAADKWARVHKEETDKARKIEMEYTRDTGKKPSWYNGEVSDTRHRYSLPGKTGP